HAANTQGNSPARNPAVAPVGQAGNPRGGSSWLGYVCFAIFAVLVIWMVVGLIRGFSGAGGGYGGAMGGGGYGYGGGGIWTSILGGMFGAMAGSWIYNNMFGGGWGHSGTDSSSAGVGGGDTGGSAPEGG